MTLEERWAQLKAEYEVEKLKQIDDGLKMAEQTLEALKKLEEAGLYIQNPEHLGYWSITGKEIWVEKKDLVKFRKVLGPLEFQWKDHWAGNEVVVSLRAKEHPTITFKYKTELKGDKCRIEEVTRTERKLVCRT